MLKIRPTYKKPQSQPKKLKSSNKANIQNTKPICFNTKGYYSPDQPYNQQYLKAKMEVYKKYRQQNQQLVVIDPKSIHRGIFIQRGLSTHNDNLTNLPPLNSNNDKIYNSFLKHYMNRKEKKEKLIDKKYNQSVGVGALSQIRCLQSSVRDFTSCKSSRAAKSIAISRTSTARSVVSRLELEEKI